MGQQRRRLGVPGALLALVFAWGCSDGIQEVTTPDPDDVTSLTEAGVESPPLFSVTTAASRGAIEICDNTTDDDGDDEIDEAQCQISPTSTPVSNGGVVPELWDDNPTCQDMGFQYGFRIESDFNDTYNIDGFNTVTVSSGDGVTLDSWSSTLGIDAVNMKGGNNSNLYVYDPEAKSDGDLASPKTSSGNPAAISHIDFCYDYELEAEKTAEAEFTRTYTWEISKSVDPASHTGFAGDEFSSQYEVTVDQTVTEASTVTGTITVRNPHSSESVGYTVSDLVDGVEAAVDCDPDTEGNQNSGTLSPGETVVCSYEASLDGAVDGTNTAEVASDNTNVPGTTASADYVFGDPIIIGYPTINVTDFFNGDDVGDPLGSASGDFTFDYTRDFTCPAEDSGLYENGVYETQFPNTAEIDETGQSDDATVDVTCYIPAEAKVTKTTTEGGEDIGQFPFTFELYAPGLVPGVDSPTETQTLGTGGGMATFTTEIEGEGTWTVREMLPTGWVSTTELTCTFDVAFPGSAGQTFECTFDNVEQSRVDLLKLTNGQQTTTQVWTFEIYAGPDGFGGTPLASASTPPALIDFGNINLDPFQTYTVCELSVPAGYSTFWQIDTDGNGSGDVTVVPCTPNEDDNPPEDLGNRCVDLGANTNIPLVSGTTLHFVVDNRAPGGGPRTPGYWKNWNRCTGGGQAANADRNGGWQEGFWLLEDVLDPSISGGVTWDNILGDGFVFSITDCGDAVNVLDQRDIDTGRKRANDAAYTLAMHLLAAQLNFGAGACTTQEVLDAALAAETLLDELDFDGTGSYLRPRDADYGYALELADYLDRYNNGEFCGDGND
ncbi:MAG: hypothetical protein GTO22_19555 [Gemmatimonadales bacterium]|nr:hypothetical protein [Gemmatimonadales bacterium]